MAQSPIPPAEHKDHPLGCLTRLVWAAVIPMTMFQAAMKVAEGRPLVGMPAVVLLITAAIVAVIVRWIDVTRLNGMTIEGEPATMTDWRRYSVAVLAVTAGLWLLASVVSRLGWMS